MRKSYAFLTAVLASFALAAAAPARADEPATLRSISGAEITFTPTDTGWQWTALATPGAETARAITDAGARVATADASATLSADWQAAEAAPGQLAFEQEAPDVGLRFRRVFSFGPAGNVLRIATWVCSTGESKTLRLAGLLETAFAGESFYETGAAPASFPLFGKSLFAGLEHVSGECHSDDSKAQIAQRPYLDVGAGWQFIATVVVGWAAPGAVAPLAGEAPMREPFLQYLEPLRVKPRDMELHTNTWWTLPLPFSEADVLKDIAELRAGFFERTGMFFDSYALDLGWSDPRTVWQLDAKRFPNGLRVINERLAELGTRAGLWVSPGSAYPEGLDNNWLRTQGYELTPFQKPGERLPYVACFARGGRYTTAFRDQILAYAREYNLGHVKLDFMLHTCDDPSHGHPVGPDSYFFTDAALADVLDSLRTINPGIALEPLVCGYPPSPWWTLHTPFIVGPAGDDVPYGRVASPEWTESLITARDIAYREAQEAWIMPTSNLETFDIIVQSPGDFQNLAAMAIGRGRWFISTYLRPSYMKPEHWDFLADLVRWARANKDYLGNARMFGGAPEKREAYGYVFHQAGKDVYCVRNPWLEERTIELPTFADVADTRDVNMIYPRRTTVARLAPGAVRPTIVLGPYETVFLETVPAAATPLEEITDVSHFATLAIDAGAQASFNESDSLDKPVAELDYTWNDTVTLPADLGAELCILIEGEPDIEGATCRVAIGGRTVTLRRAASAGQFGAAANPSPDHWVWFMATLPPGGARVDLDVHVPQSTASVGVYLRGKIAARNDDATPGSPAFPLYHAGERAWSQTLASLKKYSDDVGPGYLAEGESEAPQRPHLAALRR